MNAPIMIYNDQDKIYEEWDLILDLEGKYFLFDWNGGEFDVPVKEAWESDMLDNVKWTEENSKIMIIGIFTLWTL